MPKTTDQKCGCIIKAFPLASSLEYQTLTLTIKYIFSEFSGLYFYYYYYSISPPFSAIEGCPHQAGFWFEIETLTPKERALTTLVSLYS